jgi:hypothetical protein
MMLPVWSELQAGTRNNIVAIMERPRPENPMTPENLVRLLQMTGAALAIPAAAAGTFAAYQSYFSSAAMARKWQRRRGWLLRSSRRCWRSALTLARIARFGASGRRASGQRREASRRRLLCER